VASGECCGLLTADRVADRSSLAAARSPLGSPEPLNGLVSPELLTAWSHLNRSPLG